MSGNSPILWAGVVIVKDRKMLTLKEDNKPFLLVPGGKVEHGETDEEAAIREVDEELGVVVSNLSYLVTVHEKSKRTGQPIRFKLFTGNLEKEPDEVNLPGKTEKITWINSLSNSETGNLSKKLIPILVERKIID